MSISANRPAVALASFWMKDGALSGRQKNPDGK